MSPDLIIAIQAFFVALFATWAGYWFTGYLETKRAVAIAKEREASERAWEMRASEQHQRIVFDAIVRRGK